MARRIIIDDDYKDECIIDFKKMLDGLKFSDGKVSFIKTFAYTGRKANLYVTLKAWVKMKALVKNFDSEVAWHGVARRLGEEENDEYIVEDILVYPQIVAGATVDADKEKDETGQTRYESWKWTLTDEQFNNLRFQGHSHVNMGVTPSTTDISDQKETVERMGNDMFYIFMIMNKSGNYTLSIYDKKKNVMFENTDITMSFYEPEVDVDEFVKEAKSMARTRTTTTAVTKYDSKTGYGSNKDKKRKPRVSVASIESKKKDKSKKSGHQNQYDDDDWWGDGYGSYGCGGYDGYGRGYGSGYDSYGSYKGYQSQK